MSSNTATEETSKKKNKKNKKAAEPETKKKSSKKGDSDKPKKKKADTEEKPKKAGKGGPFKSGSGIGQIFEKCLEGTTMAKLESFAEKIEVNLPWALQHIRKGEKNGHNWKYIFKPDTDRVRVIMK